MKLWNLYPRQNLDGSDDPWQPWYDKAFGFVVRAETEESAREIDQQHGGDEVRWENSDKKTWLNPKYSVCEELLPDGEPGVIIEDFHAA